MEGSLSCLGLDLLKMVASHDLQSWTFVLPWAQKVENFEKYGLTKRLKILKK